MGLQFDSDGVPYVMWASQVIKLERDPLTEKFYLEKAEKELRETEENVKKGIAELKELLKGEPALVVPTDDDEFLKKFLRPTKYYADSAFKMMKAYYKVKKNHQDYFYDLVPSAIKLPFQHSTISVMCPRDQHGRRVMYVESGARWNPRVVPMFEVFRGMQLGLEAVSMEPRTQVSGVVVVVDTGNLSFSHIMQYTPAFARMIMEWTQDCIPSRLKAIHVINQPYIFKVLFALFRPLMREKFRSRIFFHGSDKNSLLQHVDGKALIKRYGGSLPDDEVPGILVWDMLSHYEDCFKKMNSYGYVGNSQ